MRAGAERADVSTAWLIAGAALAMMAASKVIVLI
jgi:hypothetical protein